MSYVDLTPLPGLAAPPPPPLAPMLRDAAPPAGRGARSAGTRRPERLERYAVPLRGAAARATARRDRAGTTTRVGLGDAVLDRDRRAPDRRRARARPTCGG